MIFWKKHFAFLIFFSGLWNFQDCGFYAKKPLNLSDNNKKSADNYKGNRDLK